MKPWALSARNSIMTILSGRPTLPVEAVMELLEVCLRSTYFQLDHELPRITSFFHHENIAKQHNNENVDLHEETSNSAPTCDVDVSTSKKVHVSQEEEEGSLAAVQTAEDADRLEEESQSNRPDAHADVSATTILTANSVADIAFLDKNNVIQMEDFPKIKHFEIKRNIPRDAKNHSFPYRLIEKILSNGERCREIGCAEANKTIIVFCSMVSIPQTYCR
jgi:hypothetical protein